nr:helix-turn-helix domain-containing protein [uncultured Blautia sp.]
MNTVVTSREAILAVSRKLIQTQGWGAVNIRAVARDCNISIGSVYNYFSSKTDLISAVVESVWCDIFHFPGGQGQFENFTDCIQWVFESMKRGDEKYPGFFNLHSMSFMGEEKG